MVKESNCINQKCGKELSHTEGRRPKKFCSEKCRIEFHNSAKIKGVGRGRPKGAKNKLKPNANDIIEAENRNNPLTNAARGRDDGGVNKDEIAYDNPKHDFSNIKTVRIENVLPFDFGDDKFLNVEKYTKFPSKERPTNLGERIEFDKFKKIFDDGIRAAWHLHKSKNQ